MDELKKYKRGDVREDGLVFAAYRKNTKDLEWWVTPEKLKEIREQANRASKKWRTINPENYKSTMDKYCATHKEVRSERGKDYHRRHPDYSSKKWHEWVSKNTEYNKARIAKYRQENIDAIRERSRKQHKKNPEKSRARASRRRASERNAIHPEHDPKDDQKLAKVRQLIGAEIDTDIDHIIPISRDGVHIIYNLRLLPKTINNIKHNKLDSELTPEQQQECYFWRILTRFLTCSYDYANAA
jgi:5-methylcytosine-specific restriction endonuclease McrA